MKVRNRLYDVKDYEGQYVEASNEFCPCRSCWHVYHFPEWNSLGERIDYPSCQHKCLYGCPRPKPRPFHIFYNSKRFQNRKRRDKFKCLRCGQLITLGVDECDWIVVPYRKKKRVIEYLKKKGLKA